METQEMLGRDAHAPAPPPTKKKKKALYGNCGHRLPFVGRPKESQYSKTDPSVETVVN